MNQVGGDEIFRNEKVNPPYVFDALQCREEELEKLTVSSYDG